MITTRKSNPDQPVRVLIFGVEGAGKSTFGAKADSPIFISPEGGTDHLRSASGGPVDEMLGVDTWDGVRAAIQSLVKEKHDFKTLVIDSADWLEKLAHKKIIGNTGLDIIRVNKGYGAGFRESESLHRQLLEQLSELRERRRMNIVITAHAHVKTVRDPSTFDDYDAFEIKCHDMVSSLYREWVDGLFFVKFSTFTTSENTAKARAITDGKRKIYTVKQPAFQAKNRYGMPPEMDFTENFWNEFMKFAKKGVVAETAEELLSEAKLLLEKIQDEELKKNINSAFAKAGNQVQQIKPLVVRLREIAGKN